MKKQQSKIEYMKQYRKDNAEKIRKKNQEYRRLNPKKIANWKRKDRSKNKDNYNELSRKFRLTNKYFIWHGLPVPTKPIAELCEICGGKNKTRRLHLDHCHKTMKFRGWLCGKCNRGLGMFQDNPDLLKKAASYLEPKIHD